VGTKGRRRVTAQTRRIVPTPSRVPFVPRCCQCSSSNDSRRVLFRFIQRDVATRLRSLPPRLPFPALPGAGLSARATRAGKIRDRCSLRSISLRECDIAACRFRHRRRRVHARRTRARNASAYARRSHGRPCRAVSRTRVHSECNDCDCASTRSRVDLALAIQSYPGFRGR